MFTVKHREPDGREFIYNAETVEVVPPGPSNATVGATNWDQAGIYLDAEQVSSAPNQPPTRFCKQVILFGGDETSAAAARKGGKVWVMNEQGSTVAGYDL